MEIVKVCESCDHTKKYYLTSLGDNGWNIEACLLFLERYGYIICVSSQIGCIHSCKFCASGSTKFVRNLTSCEIEEQIKIIIDDNPSLLNKGFQVTYMGSGEPLYNYEDVFVSIDYLMDTYPTLEKINISSTIPLLFMQCFEDINWEKYFGKLHFQYSLHFANDFERFKYISSDLLRISDAIEKLNIISSKIGDIYKVNYIPFDGINDDKDCINKLQQIMESTNGAILKISQMCNISTSSLKPSRFFDGFVDIAKKKIKVTEVFRSNGTDVNAGCGQFYNESLI